MLRRMSSVSGLSTNQHAIPIPAPPMVLPRSVAVADSGLHATPCPQPSFTPEENQMLLEALESSKSISWDMRQHLIRKLKTGSMSVNPKQTRSRRFGKPGSSKLRRSRSATPATTPTYKNTNIKTHKRSSNNSPFPSLGPNNSGRLVSYPLKHKK